VIPKEPMPLAETVEMNHKYSIEKGRISPALLT
jgi:hypothetical protein